MKIKSQSPDFTASQGLTDLVQSKVDLAHFYDEFIW